MKNHIGKARSNRNDASKLRQEARREENIREYTDKINRANRLEREARNLED